MTKYYKSHPKHLFWKDIDANEYLRIMPIAKTINVLYVIKNGEEQGAVIYGFILYDSYKKINELEYRSQILTGKLRHEN